MHVPLRHYLNAAERKRDEDSRRGPAKRGEPRQNHAHDISFVKMKKVQLNELARQVRQHRKDSLPGSPGSPELSSDRGIDDDNDNVDDDETGDSPDDRPSHNRLGATSSRQFKKAANGLADSAMSMTKMLRGGMTKRNAIVPGTVDDDRLRTFLKGVPAEFPLGIAIVREMDAKHIGSVEATWDRRLIDEHRSVSLMQRPWYILSPHMIGIQYWEMVIACAMIFVCFITPYEVSVMRHEQDKRGLLAVVNWLVDGVFFIDMGVQFFSGFHDAHLHQMVYDQRRICRRYLSTWFLLDLASIFPFSFILTDAPMMENLQLIRLARLVKLVKARCGAALSRHRVRPPRPRLRGGFGAPLRTSDTRARSPSCALCLARS